MEYKNVNLKLLPFTEIQASITEARNEWRETANFNTHHHARAEISAEVPEENGLRHVKPSFCPTRLGNWIELIASSQGMSRWHVFEIPRYLAQELISLYTVWCSGRKLDHDTREELRSMFPKTTTVGVNREELFQGNKWFMRVDYCSAKDSEAGHSIVESVDDIIDRLYTSMRAVRALNDVLEENPIERPKVFLIPFNAAMDCSRECRVFCPPKRRRIAAVSQYRWTAAFSFDNADNASKEAKEIYSGACVLHERILEHAERSADTDIPRRMLDEGFTFDVLRAPSGEVQLVEINPFGAMSGCGSCLFHWIQDAKLLYGLETEVELRFAV